MSRVCKKLAGLFGLAFVVGITAVASGIPPVQEASAVGSDVKIQVKVVDANFMASILNPTDGSVAYSANGVTARVSYSKAQTLSIYLTFPDGSQVLVDTVTPATEDGEVDVTLPVSDYGIYTITVNGTNLAGGAMEGDAKEFSYKAITAAVNEDNNKVEVKYGTNVCKLGFQVYKVTDTAKANPLLNPEYIIEVEQTGEDPNVIEVEIPGFDKLGPEEFTVVTTAYDCLNDEAIDSDEIEVVGAITPPKTGAISILGVTISQTDYLVTGLVVFVLAAIFALFLLSRRKKATRK